MGVVLEMIIQDHYNKKNNLEMNGEDVNLEKLIYVVDLKINSREELVEIILKHNYDYI